MGYYQSNTQGEALQTDGVGHAGSAGNNKSGPTGRRHNGGGGGAGSAGKGSDGQSAPNGGDGKLSNITGSDLYYAGGGGGANANWDAHGYNATGNGGSNVGGDGGARDVAAQAGQAHTGSGGGGGNNTGGADGGSGVVIIRYQIDTDGDGVSDKKEDDAGTDKNDPLSFPTTPTVSSDSGASLAEADIMDMADGSTVMIFKYDANSDNGQGQTDYTIDFPANVMADVLVVAGGGSGGIDAGGGGGAGGVAYTTQSVPLVGSYSIQVGRGGDFINNSSNYAENGSSDGENSRFSNELNKIEVIGGGSGAFIWSQNDGGNNGGSGGGAKYQLTSSGIGQVDASVITGAFESVVQHKGSVGNYGGTGHAGGGGGAGGNDSPSISADGEDGISIDWVNNAIGSTVYWAGGGGAGTNYHYHIGRSKRFNHDCCQWWPRRCRWRRWLGPIRRWATRRIWIYGWVERHRGVTKCRQRRRWSCGCTYWIWWWWWWQQDWWEWRFRYSHYSLRSGQRRRWH